MGWVSQPRMQLTGRQRVYGLFPQRRLDLDGARIEYTARRDQTFEQVQRIWCTVWLWHSHGVRFESTTRHLVRFGFRYRGRGRPNLVGQPLPLVGPSPSPSPDRTLKIRWTTHAILVFKNRFSEIFQDLRNIFPHCMKFLEVFQKNEKMFAISWFAMPPKCSIWLPECIK